MCTDREVIEERRVLASKSVRFRALLGFASGQHSFKQTSHCLSVKHHNVVLPLHTAVSVADVARYSTSPDDTLLLIASNHRLEQSTYLHHEQ